MRFIRVDSTLTVMTGWDVGIEGMHVGGERKLTIPAPMAYGKKAQSGIPANSTLVFGEYSGDDYIYQRADTMQRSSCSPLESSMVAHRPLLPTASY